MPSVYESTRWQERASALLRAVADIAPPGHPPSIEKAAVEEPHKKLFHLYVREMRAAQDKAQRWWSDVVKTDTKRMRGDKSQGERIARELRPLGPLSHPE